jgi:dUTPase
MNNKIFIKNNLRLEDKLSPFNVGIDVKAVNFEIKGEKINNLYSSIDYIEYDTGIFIDSLTRNYEELIYTLVYPRSSISNKNLLLCNSVGVIDPNYRDSIKLRFKYLYQPKDIDTFGNLFLIKIDENKIYKIGDKIGQLIFSKTINHKLEYVPELIPSDRDGGFGSTGE